MYTFYEYPKCSTCRKAKAELNQLGLDVKSINIKENPPSAQFLKEPGNTAVGITSLG